MSDLNITILQGRMVRDPITRNNGTSMGFFSVASNRRYKDKHNTQQQETAFVDCKCFGKWTDALAGRKKGDLVLVSGRLRTETWGTGEAQKSRLTLVCDSVHFVAPVTGGDHYSQGEDSLASANGETPRNSSAPATKMPPF